ncbi:MAG TPA: hypothetical protein VH092_06280 [Urbifossiella sp.]|jgi:hypothetical protein|nr:hypothetical protein [Urbifossiella sp.]
MAGLNPTNKGKAMDAKAAHVLGRYILVAGLAVAAVPPLLAWTLPGASSPRYQVSAPGSGNAYIIDTHTGQTWSRFAPSNQGNTNWEKEQSVGAARK